jgi:CMP-N-acetylneuraminic acid synthetase
MSSQLIDDAINTLTIFGADSLLSVRPDNSMYYQHNGNGMQPILNQERFTKLEREALYKGVGGIVLSTYEGFKNTGKMIHGKVGHIVVDQKTALGIFSDFDLQIVSKIYEGQQSNVSF